MKKSIFIIAALCAATFANAQITLLHTFEGQVNIRTIDYNQTNSYPQYLNGFVYNSSSFYYDYSYQELYRQGRWYQEHFENNTYVITFWDENFQPAGTKTITFPNIVNYEVDYFSSANLNSYTTKFFNDNEDVEYLVKYRLTNEYMSTRNYTEYRDIEYKMVLVDKNTNILYDFGEAESIQSSSSIYYIDNKWLFILTKRHYDNTTYTYFYQTEVYQINKQSPQGLTQVSAPHIPAYPNPTSSQLNIPIGAQNGTRQVNIYDMNGQLIDSKMGNDNGEAININVSNYPVGNYIYQNGNNAGQFIKQ